MTHSLQHTALRTGNGGLKWYQLFPHILCPKLTNTEIKYIISLSVENSQQKLAQVRACTSHAEICKTHKTQINLSVKTGANIPSVEQ